MYKITCVIHSLSFGGMERVMSILVNNFSGRKNIDVTILLIGKERKIDFDLDAKIEILEPNFEFNTNKRFISKHRKIWNGRFFNSY